MRYHHVTHNSIRIFGKTYTNPNAIYRKATLYLIRGKGICVVQKRFDPESKSFFYDELDAGLANDIFTNPKFGEYFKEHATTEEMGYFTVNVRKIMWALRMKPLTKEWWEQEV